MDAQFILKVSTDLSQYGSQRAIEEELIRRIEPMCHTGTTITVIPTLWGSVRIMEEESNGD